jgi:hypothetical protein
MGEPARAREWAEGVDRRILDHIPEIARDPLLVEDLHASTEAHWAAFLKVLAQPGRRVMLPAPVVELALAIAGRGLDLGVLLKVYRVGLEAVWEYATQLVGDLDGPEPRPDASELLIHFWTSMGTWVNASIERLVVVYHDELGRITQGAAAHRLDVVTSILDGSASDATRLSADLHHPLSSLQTAFVLWVDDSGMVSGLDRVARRVAKILRASEPLIVRQGSRDLWCWVANQRQPPLQELDRILGLLNDGQVRLAVGTPAMGVAGFRTSHAEALDAQRVATESRSSASLVRYGDVELVALMSVNREAAQRYVERVLGQLATNARGMQRLRQTLHAVLTGSGDLDEVAAELLVHKNTIRYRVRQAEEVLGYKAKDRRADLEVALRHMEAFGRL